MLAPRHRYSVCSAHRFRGCARLHCNITPNATCDTFTIEWQCELHCHSAPSVPIALPLGIDRTDLVRSRPFGSPGRTATRPRAYPDPIPSLPLGIERTDRTATRP